MNIPKDEVGCGDGRRCWVMAKFYGASALEVTKKITDYFEHWRPEGYSTHITKTPHESPEGYWYATVKRYSTCD